MRRVARLNVHRGVRSGQAQFSKRKKKVIRVRQFVGVLPVHAPGDEEELISLSGNLTEISSLSWNQIQEKIAKL